MHVDITHQNNNFVNVTPISCSTRCQVKKGYVARYVYGTSSVVFIIGV